MYGRPFDGRPGYVKLSGVAVGGWLRRNGPSVPHGVLQRLFRQRRVRLADTDGTVRRAAKSSLVAEGQRILLPLDVLQAHARELHPTDPCPSMFCTPMHVSCSLQAVSPVAPCRANR